MCQQLRNQRFTNGEHICAREITFRSISSHRTCAVRAITHAGNRGSWRDLPDHGRRTAMASTFIQSIKYGLLQRPRRDATGLPTISRPPHSRALFFECLISPANRRQIGLRNHPDSQNRFGRSERLRYAVKSLNPNRFPWSSL